MRMNNFGAATKLVSVATLLGLGGVGLFATTAVEAQGGNITAQSAMVDIQSASSAYQIEGEITWKYDKDIAETYFTNTLTSGPVITVGNGVAPATPAAPAPEYNKLNGWLNNASGPRCVFFSGGALPSTTYTQTVNLPKGWKYTYTYTVAPTVESVEPYTAWTSEQTGGGSVTLSFSGFIASESYLKSSKQNKYSFTADNRVSGVSASLNGGEPVNLNDTDTNGDLINDSITVVPAAADFIYYGNGGVFGNSAGFSALHAAGGGLAATSVNTILNGDAFLGNNNDIAAGNVHQAPFSVQYPGITQPGDYTITVNGTIKSNTATASQTFAVTSNITTIGGC